MVEWKVSEVVSQISHPASELVPEMDTLGPGQVSAVYLQGYPPNGRGSWNLRAIQKMFDTNHLVSCWPLALTSTVPPSIISDLP